MATPPSFSKPSLFVQVPAPVQTPDMTAMASPGTSRLRFPTSQHPAPSTERQNDSPDGPEHSKKRKALLTFDELPEWHQDNVFIRTGYRAISGSSRLSFASWLYLHNESVNIYSHLIPAIAFLLGECYIHVYLSRTYTDVTVTDYLIFSFFLLTAVVCLGLSATYHTLLNHSHKFEQIWLRLDLVGIVVLTLGDFVSGIYMVFWCEPLERKIYWSMVGNQSTSSNSQQHNLLLTLLAPDRDSWFAHHLHYGSPEAPGPQIPFTADAHVRVDWNVRLCAINTWDPDVWHLANDETVRHALLFGGRILFAIGGLDLCSKQATFSGE